ncbi:hypothetical protein HMPREF3213_00610 [Heyndrickxia coagulans]|uniref:Uncharacterized protein n=1 Tax=Heyndrickxia coagulans TaxID=1398 RepID=A0A133KZM6_HEYCO|nr:hypothetical protein HMPREF3213_00610 [Heyndrickxia coagulans]
MIRENPHKIGAKKMPGKRCEQGLSSGMLKCIQLKTSPPAIFQPFSKAFSQSRAKSKQAAIAIFQPFSGALSPQSRDKS